MNGFPNIQNVNETKIYQLVLEREKRERESVQIDRESARDIEKRNHYSIAIICIGIIN